MDVFKNFETHVIPNFNSNNFNLQFKIKMSKISIKSVILIYFSKKLKISNCVYTSYLYYQIDGVKYLHLAHLTTARIGKIGFFVVDRKCA